MSLLLEYNADTSIENPFGVLQYDILTKLLQEDLIHKVRHAHSSKLWSKSQNITIHYKNPNFWTVCFRSLSLIGETKSDMTNLTWQNKIWRIPTLGQAKELIWKRFLSTLQNILPSKLQKRNFIQHFLRDFCLVQKTSTTM